MTLQHTVKSQVSAAAFLAVYAQLSCSCTEDKETIIYYEEIIYHSISENIKNHLMRYGRCPTLFFSISITLHNIYKHLVFVMLQ